MTLYIGKAQRRGSLKKRIREYIRYGYGQGKTHRGGRAVWQAAGYENLWIGWEECSDAKECAYLDSYRKHSVEASHYPAANWRR